VSLTAKSNNSSNFRQTDKLWTRVSRT